MVRIKMVDSFYRESTGYSEVTLATDCGLFTGDASLHPDDKEYESKYAGCRYAEMRALIKYWKRKAYIANYQIKSLTKVMNIIKNRKYHNENSIEFKEIEKEIYSLENEKADYKRNVETLTEGLKKSMEEREQILKDIYSKKKNKEKQD